MIYPESWFLMFLRVFAFRRLFFLLVANGVYLVGSFQKLSVLVSEYKQRYVFIRGFRDGKLWQVVNNPPTNVTNVLFLLTTRSYTSKCIVVDGTPNEYCKVLLMVQKSEGQPPFGWCFPPL